MLEDLVRDLDVVLIVLARHPQTQHLGAVAVDHLLRGDHIAHRLGHLLALAVDHVAVGEHTLVGRPAAGAHRGEQRGLEPAAVLVAALEVEVRGRTQLRPLFEHRRVAGARVEPDIEDVRLLAELAPAAGAGDALGDEIGGLVQKPGIRPFLLKQLVDAPADRLALEDLAAGGAGEHRHRHTPGALPGETPVGSGLDHAVDALLAPGGGPAHLVDRRQGLVPQLQVVHGNEPLRRGPVHDRFLAAPAVRIAVVETLLLDERAVRGQVGDDPPVHLRHLLARVPAGLGGEAAVVAHR